MEIHHHTEYYINRLVMWYLKNLKEYGGVFAVLLSLLWKLKNYVS